MGTKNDSLTQLEARSGDEPPRSTPDDAGRRAALEKLGAMAAWTAPAMLTLLASERAAGACSFPPCD